MSLSEMERRKNNQLQLNAIQDALLAENVSPHLADQATQVVFGDGDPTAEMVFVGEAPGKKEDEQGIPFVGAAGKLLGQLLESIGLTRKDVYITNIVKYRTPNNRDRLPNEVQAFLPYLRRQIAVIQPTLIVTLGRHSMDCLLPGFKISHVHGQPQRIPVKHFGLAGSPGADGVQGSNDNRANRTNGTKSEARNQLTQQPAAKLGSASGSARRQDELTWVILPLYHPAAALYNGGLRNTLFEDFSKIPNILSTAHTA